MARHPGPVYFRIDKNERPRPPGAGGPIRSGPARADPRRLDVLLLSTGSVAYESSRPPTCSRRRGSPAVAAVMAHLPFEPAAELIELSWRTIPAAVTAEEGSTAGGLGSLAAEAIARARPPLQAASLGVSRAAPPLAGAPRTCVGSRFGP